MSNIEYINGLEKSENSESSEKNENEKRKTASLISNRGSDVGPRTKRDDHGALCQKELRIDTNENFIQTEGPEELEKAQVPILTIEVSKPLKNESTSKAGSKKEGSKLGYKKTLKNVIKMGVSRKKNTHTDYAKSSFYIFSLDNNFRKTMINITESMMLEYLVRAFLILEVVAIWLRDYSYRINSNTKNNSQNTVSFYLVLACDIFFFLESSIKMIAYGLVMEKYTFLRSGWNVINMIFYIASFLAYIPNNVVTQIFNVIKACRFVRICRSFPSLKTNVNAFFKTIVTIGTVFHNLAFLLVFYSILSLNLFKGLLENRCRFEEWPPEDDFYGWRADPSSKFLCGYKSCPAGTYCKNPANYDYPAQSGEEKIQEFTYGMISFDNFVLSFLTNFNFALFSGWGLINDLYWDAFHPAVVTIYSVSLLLLIGIIMINFLIAALYEGFIINQKEMNMKLKGILGENLEAELTENDTKRGTIFDHKDPSRSPTKKKIKEALKNKGQSGGEDEPLSTNRKARENSASMAKSQINIKKNITKSRNPTKNFLRTMFEESQTFFNVMLILVLINIIILCSDFHGIGSRSWKALLVIDYMLTAVFTIEMILRLYAFGIKAYWRDNFEKLDTIIIILNFIELVYELVDKKYNIYDRSETEGVKGLKVLRIFRFFISKKLWRDASSLFIEMFIAIYKIKEYIVTVFVFLIVTAMIGRELMAYRVRYRSDGTFDLKNGKSPRINFDTLTNSLIASVLIFFDVEWDSILYDYMRGISKFISIFIAIVVIIGDIFLMKIFMALFVNKLLISENIKIMFRMKNDWSSLFRNLKETFLYWIGIAFRIKDRKSTGNLGNMGLSQSVREGEKKNSLEMREIVIGATEREQNGVKQIEFESQDLKANKEADSNPGTNRVVTNQENNLKSSQNYTSDANLKQKLTASRKSSRFRSKEDLKLFLIGKSCYLWDSESNFRKQVFIIVSHKNFERLVLLGIILSCILLILRNPMEDPNSDFNQTLFYTDLVVLFIYFLELGLKIIAFGFFFNGELSFMRDFYNFLDFLLFVLTTLGTIDAKILLFKNTNLRVWRSLRILKLLRFSEGLRMATETLFQSLPQVLQLFAFFSMFFLAYSVIGTKSLKGAYFECMDIDLDLISRKVINKSDCFDWGGNWIRKDLNFDNVAQALGSLFQLSTTEEWTQSMLNAWDHRGYGLQPTRDNHLYWSFFHFSFYFLGNLILVNMMISILIEKYLVQKNEKSPQKGYTDEQKEWMDIKKAIFNTFPKKRSRAPVHHFRKKVFLLIKNRLFQKTLVIFTFLNSFQFALHWHRQSYSAKQALNYINLFFLICFVFELVCKMIAKGYKKYFSRGWYRFDVIIIIASWVCFIITMIPDFEHNRPAIAACNSIQFLKVLRLVRKIGFLKKLFTTILNMLPQVYNIALLLVIVILIYGLIGVELFCFIKPQDNIGNRDTHFRSSGISFFTLIRAVTGEGGYLFLNDCTRKMSPRFVCKTIINYQQYKEDGLIGCGNSWGYIYWYSFQILVTLLIMNLFIAMLMSASEELAKIEEIAIERYQLNDIKLLWREFDPKGLGYITYKDFWTFTSQIALKFNVDMDDLLEVENKTEFLKALSLPVYANQDSHIFCYKFHDVILSLSKMSVTLKYGILDLEPENKEKTDGINPKKLPKGHYKESMLTSQHLHFLISMQRGIRLWKQKKLKLSPCIGDIGDAAIELMKKNNINPELLKKQMTTAHKNRGPRRQSTKRKTKSGFARAYSKEISEPKLRNVSSKANLLKINSGGGDSDINIEPENDD